MLSWVPQTTMCRTLQARLKPLQPVCTAPTTSYAEKRTNTVATESYVKPSIHSCTHKLCLYIRITRRPTPIHSPPSKLKAPRCEHWGSVPIPTCSHPPDALPLEAPTPQQQRPRRCCTTPTTTSSCSCFHQHGTSRGSHTPRTLVYSTCNSSPESTQSQI